jgi:hypothetical protein
MSTNFPTSLDNGTSLPNPTTSNNTNSPSHSSLHANVQDATKAIEAKVGIGASTPTANTLLFGSGTGTSAWTALTSAQLAATLSDETGTGSAVFATTPTLVTPKVDTINESTPANGVTIDGLNIKDNALNTNNSVVTNNVTDLAITTAKINTDAVTDAKLIYGKLRSRQGGSATDWSTTGTTTYDYSATNTFMQTGTRAITTDNFVITFPTAFNQVPNVIATVTTAASVNGYVLLTVRTATTFTVRVMNGAGAVSTTETITWLAVGE